MDFALSQAVHVLSPAETEVLRRFKELPFDSLRLFCRLIRRKTTQAGDEDQGYAQGRWFSVESLEGRYPEIRDLRAALDGLCWMTEAGSSLTDDDSYPDADSDHSVHALVPARRSTSIRPGSQLAFFEGIFSLGFRRLTNRTLTI